MTHLCVGHDSFGVHDGIKLDYLMRRIHTYDMTDCLWDVSHWCVGHDSLMHGT